MAFVAPSQILSLEAIAKVNGIDLLAKKIATKKGAKELLSTWADIYFASTSAKMNTGGGGQWPPLKDRTIKDRVERADRGGKPYRATSTSILKDTLQLLQAVHKSGGRGQIKRLSTNDFTAELGISGKHLYYDPRKGMLTKITKQRPIQKKIKNPPKRYLGELAYYHELSGRKIIGPPNSQAINKMNVATAVWMRKLIK